MEDVIYLSFALSPIGPKRFQKLLAIFRSAKHAWNGNAQDFKQVGIAEIGFARFDSFKKTFDVAEYLEKLRKTKVEFVPFGDKYYPVRLSEIDAPPIGLFIKGNKKLLVYSSPELDSGSQSVIGVVGARKITSYGSQVTSNLVDELCSAGFVIASGMALGVDGVAHKAAIDNHGLTIAVLGCGVDCPYPRENEKLYEEILDSGGLIISEYPLGMPASPGTFPARNRIIAGISSSVLITEAAEDSGSLITAEHAIKQGKTVFAVPGPITSRMSDGTSKLLKQGAVLVSSASDILEELNVKRPHFAKASRGEQSLRLTKDEKQILTLLENEERTIDEIGKETNIKAAKLSIILSEMELAGLIRNSSGKFAIKNI